MAADKASGQAGQKRDQNYAWVIFSACTLVVFIFIGASTNAKSLHLQPVCEGVGITRVTYSYVLLAGSLVSAFFSFMLGRIHKRLTLRTMMIIGTGCATLGNISLAAARSLPGVLLGEILIGTCTGISAMAVISLMIRNWFANRNGTVLGALYMATGLGSIVFAPIMGRLIQNRGYRSSYLFQAGLMAFVFLVVLIFVRETPQSMGKVPYLFRSGGKQVREPDKSVGMTLAEAKRSPRFYLIMMIALFLGFGTNALQGTYGAYIGSDLAYGTVFAAGIMSTIYVVNSIVKIPLGWLIDRFSARVSLVICAAAMALAAIWMFGLTATTPILAYLFGICHGVGNVSYTVVSPHVPRTVYGEKDTTSFTGMYMACNMVGSAVASPAANIIYQATGSYRPIYFAMIVMFSVTVVLGLLLVRPAYPKA